MKRAVVIPARGGSVRLPRKNLRLFHGRPIIEYSIETAIESGLFDWVVVSTDDDEIEKVSLDSGATMIHRRKPDDGRMGTQEVTKNALLDLDLKPHFVCCLYATAPLVLPKDLHAGLSCLIQREGMYSMAVGVDPLRDAGAFYWSAYDALMDDVPLLGPRTVMVPMPESRVCDINTLEDWVMCETKYALLRRNP